MKQIVLIMLLCGAAWAAAPAWITGTITGIEYENAAPVGPTGIKGVRYAVKLPEGKEIVAYDISGSFFHGFRKELGTAGDTADVAVKKDKLYLKAADGKVHKLWIHKSTQRPK